MWCPWSWGRASALQSCGPEFESRERVSASEFLIGPHIRREYRCSSQEPESREISTSCKNLFLNLCRINIFNLKLNYTFKYINVRKERSGRVFLIVIKPVISQNFDFVKNSNKHASIYTLYNMIRRQRTSRLGCPVWNMDKYLLSIHVRIHF